MHNSILVIEAFLNSPEAVFAFVAICLSLCVLYISFLTTRDWRKRMRFSYETFHMNEAQLVTAYDRNLWVVARYVQAKIGKKPAAQSAENALVMCTVLAEHLAELKCQPAPDSYLQARRACLHVARDFDLDKHSPEFTPL